MRWRWRVWCVAGSARLLLGMSGTTYTLTRQTTTMNSTLRHDDSTHIANTGTYAEHTNHTPEITDSTNL